MSDIIDTAFRQAKPRNWDDLGHWLRYHAADVKGARHLIEWSQRALQDGLLFPDTPDEARLIMRKYEYQAEHHA